MRRDLLLGIVLSAVFHILIFWGDKLLPKSKPQAVVVEEKPKVC